MTKVKTMELYKTILKDYPDVLTAEEMCQALQKTVLLSWEQLYTREPL